MLFQRPIREIVYYCGHWQECFEDMVDHVQFVEGIPEDIRSLVPTGGSRGVLVLDDVVVILGNAAMMIRVLFLNFLTTAT